MAWLTLSFLLCSEVIQSFLIGFYQPNAMDKTLFFCRRVFQRTAWQCLCWRWRWLGCWKQNLCFCWQGTQTVFQVQAFTLLAFSLAVTKSFCPDWSHSDADLPEMSWNKAIKWLLSCVECRYVIFHKRKQFLYLIRNYVKVQTVCHYFYARCR